MNQGHYVFSQIVRVLPKRYFERLVAKYPDRTGKWSFTHWNQLLVLIYGQLAGCRSLRELSDLLVAHYRKAYFLGFGAIVAKRSTLSLANNLRDYRIYEAFAYHMVELAQKARIDKEFDLHGKFYAFDSTTIDLCMALFPWATFHHEKSGIKMHTLLDMTTQIPVFYHITNALVHDVNAMNLISFEKMATYVFDRGYWDLERLFKINMLGAFFVIREKGAPTFEIIAGENILDGDDNAKDIALLYKYRWLVELFFKWIKQHLIVKKFGGNSENAVRIQLYAAISTYCAVAILEQKLQLNRSIYEVLRILSNSLLTKDNVKDLFVKSDIEISDDTTFYDDYIEELDLDFE